MRDFKYHLKLQLDSALLLSLFILGALIIMVFNAPGRETRTLRDLFPIFEIYLPLFAAYLMSRLVSMEVEDRMLELIISYPQKKWILLGKKLITAALILTLVFGTAAVLLYMFYVPFNIGTLIKIALGPVLFLGGVGLLVSTVTGSMLTGFVVSVGYWGFEMLTQGEITGKFALFLASYPVDGAELVLNRIMLMAGGILLSLIAFRVVENAERMINNV